MDNYNPVEENVKGVKRLRKAAGEAPAFLEDLSLENPELEAEKSKIEGHLVGGIMHTSETIGCLYQYEEVLDEVTRLNDRIDKLKGRIKKLERNKASIDHKHIPSIDHLELRIKDLEEVQRSGN